MLKFNRIYKLMNKITTIYQKDVFPEMAEDTSIEYEDRNTGKAIIVDSERKIGLVGNKQNDFLQLPGGGIDDGEDIGQGVIRECLEETGCNVELKSEVGIVDDYRPRDKKHCINFCYVAAVVGEKGVVSYTDDESNIGMYTKWVDVKTALDIFRKQEVDLKDGKVTFYNTGFNILRDLKFLENAITSGLIHE
jgi:ADP-ribose pyrophosphatase YjhB (NUDIX family)